MPIFRNTDTPSYDLSNTNTACENLSNTNKASENLSNNNTNTQHLYLYLQMQKRIWTRPCFSDSKVSIFRQESDWFWRPVAEAIHIELEDPILTKADNPSL